MTKIFVSGGSGSGKTTYAKQLSNQYNIPHFDLDDIYWITYGTNRSKKERSIQLEHILSSNPSWVIEGVYSSAWIEPIINQCDKIVIINPPTWRRQYRIIKRYIKNKFSNQNTEHNETITSISKLLCWAQRYEPEYLPELLTRIKNAGKLYTIITNNKNIR